MDLPPFLYLSSQSPYSMILEIQYLLEYVLVQIMTHCDYASIGLMACAKIYYIQDNNVTK